MLSADELERYARHIVLREVGGPGQLKLKSARVLVIGAGGLGAPLLQYLAAAGIGTIGVMDDDTVSLSNLQRQVIHGTGDIGRPKVQSAFDALRRINPHVAVRAHFGRFGPESKAMLADYDIVADGSDNFDTRYALADACAAAAVPLVSAAVGRFDGSLTILKPYASTADGRTYPSYRDLFPAAPPAGAVPACAEAGVIGALTGIMGAMMAMEVIKEICGIGEGLAGRLLLVDSLSMRFETISYM